VRPAPGASLETAPQGDDQLVTVARTSSSGVSFETLISDGPNRVCETRRAGSDQQLRAVGHAQPTILRGSSDWDRLVYAFQATEGYEQGRETPEGEDVPTIPMDDPDLAVTRFITVPAGTVAAGDDLRYVATIVNKGGPVLDGDVVVVEQTLPPGTSVRSCAPSSACQRTPDGIRVEVPAADFEDELTVTVVVKVAPSVRAGTRLESTVRTGLADLGGPIDCDREISCRAHDDVEANEATVTVKVLADDDDGCPPGSYIIRGTSGPDVLIGTSGNDCILGGDGDDTLVGNGGDDVLAGGKGRDILQGGPGNDRLLGGDGDDQLDGGDGDDVLDGGEGNDQLNGGRGDDCLDGGPGYDSCTGGAGGDRFLACESQSALGSFPAEGLGGTLGFEGDPALTELARHPIAGAELEEVHARPEGPDGHGRGHALFDVEVQAQEE
jgi:Ca2+-binding RTX toxin-like protein